MSNPFDELKVPIPFYRITRSVDLRATLAADFKEPKPPQENVPDDPIEQLRGLEQEARKAYAARDLERMKEVDAQARSIYDREMDIIAANLRATENDLKDVAMWRDYESFFTNTAEKILNMLQDSMDELVSQKNQEIKPSGDILTEAQSRYQVALDAVNRFRDKDGNFDAADLKNPDFITAQKEFQKASGGLNQARSDIKPPEYKVFQNVQEEYDTFKARRDAARAAGKPDARLEDVVRQYEASMKKPKSEPKPEPKIEPKVEPAPIPKPEPVPVKTEREVQEEFARKETITAKREATKQQGEAIAENETRDLSARAVELKKDPAGEDALAALNYYRMLKQAGATGDQLEKAQSRSEKLYAEYRSAHPAVLVEKPETLETETQTVESPQAKENEDLRRQVEELRRQITELQSETTKKPERKGEEGPRLHRIEELIAAQVGEEQSQEFGKSLRPSLIDRLKRSSYTTLRDLNHWWWSVAAKRAKDKLTDLDSRIAKMRKEQEEFMKKSFLHTATAPIRYDLFGDKWYAPFLSGLAHLEKVREEYAAKLESYNNYRDQQEIDRAEMINQAVARDEFVLHGYEVAARKAKEKVQELDRYLDDLYQKHGAALIAESAESDVHKKVQHQMNIQILLGAIRKASHMKERAGAVYGQENALAAQGRAAKDRLLKSIPLSAPETSYESKHEAIRKKVKNQTTAPAA